MMPSFARTAALAAMTAVMPATTDAQPRALPTGPLLMGYHDSWRERPVSDGARTLLAATPGAVDVVAVAFVRPNAVLRGIDLSGTGLSFGFDAVTLRGAIAAARSGHPRRRILLSVGGARATGWDRLDAVAIARLVRTVGADGVDLDYEPEEPGCARARDGAFACASDARWRSIVARMRAAMPRPYILSVAGWSVGAFGATGGQAGPPSKWTGVMRWLREPAAAAAIDLVVVCAYDVGPAFDPLSAVAAYRRLWRGPMVMGLEVPFAGAGGPFFTPARASALAAAAWSGWRSGTMVYSLREPPDPRVPAPAHPDGIALACAAARGLRRDDCDPPR